MRAGRCGLGDDAKQSGMFTSDPLFGPQPPKELEIMSVDIKGGIALAVKLDMSCPVLLLRYHSWFDSTEWAHRTSSHLRSSVSLQPACSSNSARFTVGPVCPLRLASDVYSEPISPKPRSEPTSPELMP